MRIPHIPGVLEDEMADHQGHFDKLQLTWVPKVDHDRLLQGKGEIVSQG